MSNFSCMKCFEIWFWVLVYSPGRFKRASIRLHHRARLLRHRQRRAEFAALPRRARSTCLVVTTRRPSWRWAWEGVREMIRWAAGLKERRSRKKYVDVERKWGRRKGISCVVPQVPGARTGESHNDVMRFQRQPAPRIADRPAYNIYLLQFLCFSSDIKHSMLINLAEFKWAIPL